MQPDAMPDGDDEATATTDVADEETQARHIASRAELLPEELAAGSDDPQEQARVILEESEERTEHPEPGPTSESMRESADEADEH